MKKISKIFLYWKVNKHISLFYPHISKDSYNSIKKVLSSRWIGQGHLWINLRKISQKNFAIICLQLPLVQAQMPCT